MFFDQMIHPLRKRSSSRHFSHPFTEKILMSVGRILSGRLMNSNTAWGRKIE